MNKRVTDSSRTFILDEHMLSTKLGTHINVPIRVFSLKALGIDQESFIRFMVSQFSILHMDPYDAKRNKVEFLRIRFPKEGDRLRTFLRDYYADVTDLDSVHDLVEQLNDQDRHEFDRIGMTARRKRSIARFIFKRSESGEWESKRVPAPEFTQSVAKDDPRTIIRKFHEASSLVTDYSGMQKLMEALANMVREVRPEARKLVITMHLMFVFADALLEGDNSPEGIHQDGADYIVSALVMERAGITGGESVVFNSDKTQEYLRYTLQPGEGLFQDDRKLWHVVTPIKEDPSVPPPYGNRSIIGFDIQITG